MSKIKASILCEKEDLVYFRMISEFSLLSEYAIFLIKIGSFNKIFEIYNYIFEKYFPENVSSLDNINYKNTFLGKHAKETSEIYRGMLDLWIVLQEKTYFDGEEFRRLKNIYNKVEKLMSKL